MCADGIAPAIVYECACAHTRVHMCVRHTRTHVCIRPEAASV